MDSPELEQLKEFEKTEKPGEDWSRSNTFEKALDTGNLEIIKFFVEKWTAVSKTKQKLEDYRKLHVLPYLNDDITTLKILEYLMPHFYTEDPKRPGFYLMEELYSLVVDCSFASTFLMKYFFDKYYTEEHNSLYPLLEKLERIFDLSEIPCLTSLLHSDIKTLDDLVDFDNMDDIATVLMKLISGDSEMMQLAIEVAKILVDKKIYRLNIESLLGSRLENIDDEPVVDISNLHEFKRLFQFVYHLLDYGDFPILILKWNLFCQHHRKYFHTCFVFVAYLSFINSFVQSNGKKCMSLQEICQRVIKKTIFIAAVFNAKETMNRIWSLKLPVRIKCNMLYILDASWMDELQEN